MGAATRFITSEPAALGHMIGINLRKAAVTVIMLRGRAVAMDRSTEHKHMGSHEIVARAVGYIANRTEDLRTLFDMID